MSIGRVQPVLMVVVVVVVDVFVVNEMDQNVYRMCGNGAELWKYAHGS